MLKDFCHPVWELMQTTIYIRLWTVCPHVPLKFDWALHVYFIWAKKAFKVNLNSHWSFKGMPFSVLHLLLLHVSSLRPCCWVHFIKDGVLIYRQKKLFESHTEPDYLSVWHFSLENTLRCWCEDMPCWHSFNSLLYKENVLKNCQCKHKH